MLWTDSSEQLSDEDIVVESSWEAAMPVSEEELIIIDDEDAPTSARVSAPPSDRGKGASPSSRRAAAPATNKKTELPHFDLPPPRLPPPRQSLRSLAPVLAPTSPSVRALPAPTAPPVRSARQRITSAVRGRPSMVWGGGLLAAGAALGFGLALAMQPPSRTASATPVVVENKIGATTLNAAPVAPAPVAEVAAPAPAKMTPSSISFDTPLDIRVPAPVPAAAPAAVSHAKEPTARPAAKAEPKPEPRPAAIPTVNSKAERDAGRTIVAKASEPPAPKSMDPSAIDALVREQLRSSLR